MVLLYIAPTNLLTGIDHQYSNEPLFKSRTISMSDYTFRPIGFIRSCFKEKFGVPRQPGLVPEAGAILEIVPEFQRSEAFRDLVAFSHIWILFVFHQCIDSHWRPTVRPPRLGGNQRVGVFASRSGFRPNPIGQSAVELVNVETGKGILNLHLKGVDLVDGTPVLDIKPYLPYADSLPQAKSGYAPEKPAARFKVLFSRTAQNACLALEQRQYPQLKQLIINLLALDPRPGYADTTTKSEYGMRLWELNITFKVMENHFLVQRIEAPHDAFGRLPIDKRATWGDD
jgi:tRNA (adenine37-N6)-methyltransferase